MTIKDKRYQMGLEFTGASNQQVVLRWCGDFVSAHESTVLAEVAAALHAEKRGHNHTGWTLLASHNDDVVWLLNGSKHRVVYGGDVETTRRPLAAARRYGACVLHALECAGNLYK